MEENTTQNQVQTQAPVTHKIYCLYVEVANNIVFLSDLKLLPGDRFFSVHAERQANSEERCEETHVHHVTFARDARARKRRGVARDVKKKARVGKGQLASETGAPIEDC